MTEKDIRARIVHAILSCISGEGERRSQALREVLGIAVPRLDEASLAGIAAKVPELPLPLYQKWVGLFADRLLETAPREQLEDLCRDTPESAATLQLVYSMFMESERMEKMIAADLRALAGGNDAAEDESLLVPPIPC